MLVELNYYAPVLVSSIGSCILNCATLSIISSIGRTETHEQPFFACNLGAADEREYGGRWNQLLR
jgi:hypothetical protein